jgi:hypothetical protein
MKTFKQYVVESYTPTLTLWHGGDLKNGIDDNFVSKKGRAEFSSGLYLTTHYGTAQRYSKGSRRLYRITIEKGNDADDVIIPTEEMLSFVKTYVIKAKLKEVYDAINRRSNLDAGIFINIIVNHDAIKPTNTGKLRMFLVQQGVDYTIVDNAFGWHERMIVLFNMKKIIDKKVITPKDKIEEFDLPTEWS